MPSTESPLSPLPTEPSAPGWSRIPWPAKWQLLARGVAGLYACGLLLHRGYVGAVLRLGRKDPQTAPFPTLGIGNVHAGGSGKTPLALWWLKSMDHRSSGKPWGYLSRGYGRPSTDFRWVSAEDTAAEVGDEALMAAARRPEKTVGVAANRRKGLAIFAQESNCAGVVLDDVLQHRWVQPTAMLVACPWDRPWDRESLLPAGTLRDFPRSAGRAQAVVVTGTPLNATREELVLLAARLRRAANKTAPWPVFFAQWVYGDWIPWKPGEPSLRTNTEVQGPSGPVLCTAGIARPERFLAAVQARVPVAKTAFYPDHTPVDAPHLLALARQTGIQDVVLTAKDAARMESVWRTGASQTPGPVDRLRFWILPVEVGFLEGPDGGEPEALAYLCAHVGLS